MPTPDELAAQIREWADLGDELADQVAALDDDAPAPGPIPAPTPEPAPVPPPAGPPAKPTGLACVIGPSAAPELSWDSAPDATAWEVVDLLNTRRPLQATVTEPRSVRSELKPGQRRRYVVIAVGPGGRSIPSDPIDVPPATGDEPSPEPPPTTGGARYPGDICGKNWYLTLPTGQQGSPDTVKQPTLATYSSEFFNLTAAGDGIIFRVWHGGVTTSGSPNPRSELRECNPDGSLAWWPMRTGRHAMTVVGQVNRLTTVRPHVVLHQVHDRNDDTSVWRLEGAKLWITDGDNTHAHLITDSFALGTRYTLTTEIGDGKIHYRYNGDVVPFELAIPAGDAYFKVGCYAQTNPKSAPSESTSEYAEVVVFAVDVTHASA